MTDIGLDDWREAFDAAHEATLDDGGLTGSELRELLGMDSRAFQTTVRKMIREGTLKVYKARRPNILGEMRAVPVYKLISND